jgi:hypothetical protein
MKTLLSLILLLLIESIQAQDCKDSIKNYSSYIDLTKRNVVLFADERPGIFKDNSLPDLINREINLDDIKCCPMYIWFAFIVETDSTLSNIVVCPQFAFCDSTELISREGILLKDRFRKLFSGIKTAPGLLNGHPIAVEHYSKIHYECMGF